MPLSDKLIYYRKKNNYLQKEIAEEIGITKRQYIKYEKGQVNPKIKTLEILASVYKIKLSDFFN